MPQLKSSKPTSIRRPVGSRPGEPGFVGIRAETRGEGIRRRLIPTQIFEKGQELLGVGQGDAVDIDPGPGIQRVGIPVVGGAAPGRGFATNSRTFRLLKGIKTIKRAAGKKGFTEADKNVLNKLIGQIKRLRQSVSKMSSNSLLKFLDPSRGFKPPSNFDLPNLKNIGELKRLANSAEFRGKLDVVRQKLKRPSIEIQVGKPIRDIEQRAAGTGKPSGIPILTRKAKLERRAKSFREAVRRTFGRKRKKK